MTLAPEITLATLALALVAGAASFLSPCVLPLLPGYLSFVSGTTVGDLESRNRQVILGTLAFVAGFSLMFTLMGAGAAFLGGAVLQNRRTLQIVGGVLLIVFGVLIMGVIHVGFLERERRAVPFRSRGGLVGAFITGLVFAIGWTPCIGPILASILTVAASGQDPGTGAILLLTYSLGLGIPFLLSGLFFTRAMNAFGWVKRHFKAIRVVSGILLITYGLLMVTGRFTWLSQQLAPYQLFEF